MKLIAFVLLFFLSLQSYSHDYIKTIEEGKQWSITRPLGMGTFASYIYQTLCDTTINNKHYYSVINVQFNNSLMGFSREDTNAHKIFFLNKDSVTEKLIVDYDLNENDTFVTSTGFTMIVDSVTESFKFGQMRKIIYFDLVQQFIEGVGYSFDGILNAGFYGYTTNVTNTLSSCNNIISAIHVSENKNQMTIFPNPVRQFMSIKNLDENKPVQIKISNMIGQNVLEFKSANNDLDLSALPDGIYFLMLDFGKTQITQKFIKVSF